MPHPELGVCAYCAQIAQIAQLRNLRCALRLIFSGCAICVAHLQSNLRFRNLRFKKITAQIMARYGSKIIKLI